MEAVVPPRLFPSVCHLQVRMGYMHYFLFWHSMLQKVFKLMEPFVPWASSHVWYWFLSFGCKKQFFPSASIWSKFILTWLLWEGIYICKKKDYIWNDIILGNDSFRVRNNSFHQHQFDPNSSWLDFFEKVFIYVKERLFLKWYKGRKRLFLSHSIWSKSVLNNFSEKFFAKIKSLSIVRIINKPIGAKFKSGLKQFLREGFCKN